MQIPGRLVIAPIVRRAGLARAVGGAHLAALAGTVSLLAALAGTPPTALASVFVITAGLSLGLLWPLNGLLLLPSEVYGDARLGMLSGATVIVTSAATAGGAWVVGAVIDGTGSTAAGLAFIAVGQVLGVGALIWQRSAPSDDEGGAIAPEPARTSAGNVRC